MLLRQRLRSLLGGMREGYLGIHSLNNRLLGYKYLVYNSINQNYRLLGEAARVAESKSRKYFFKFFWRLVIDRGLRETGELELRI